MLLSMSGRVSSKNGINGYDRKYIPPQDKLALEVFRMLLGKHWDKVNKT